jgi:hypothetical protein
LGGVYAYIDNNDQLVMVDGEYRLVRVAAAQPDGKAWVLQTEVVADLRGTIDSYCALEGLAPGCDGVVSITPGAQGVIWFATRAAVVGIVNPQTEVIESMRLNTNERIDNSFSTMPDGRAAIVTDQALYLLSDHNTGVPVTVWRHTYDRGVGRKPGQLSFGSGATPTLFGPETGAEYVTITDNAADRMALIVRDASINGGGGLVCEIPLFEAGTSGTENSAIGIGRSVFVASTYGYPYPAQAVENAGPPTEETKIFDGGMVRVDVNEDGVGCTLVWSNKVRSAAVPKLSTADQLIYTVERKSANRENRTSLLDTYHFTVVDPQDGSVLAQKLMGAGPLDDTLQTAGNLSQNGVFWQGRIGGITRIMAK